MNLLICTQKVDKNDDVLGFFHRWLMEFSKRYDKVTVICLQRGKVDLPENVEVLSLGKESRQSRFQYTVLFYRYIWEYRKNYEVVLVHMNKEYVFLGGLFWRLFKKRILFWYNHPRGSLMANIAYKFANHVFYTSPQSYFSNGEKAHQMPVGIDTNYFHTHKTPDLFHLLIVGRISPIKYTLEMVKAVKLLVKKDKRYRLTVCGSFSKRDKEYYDSVFYEGQELIASGNLLFHGSVPNSKILSVYESHGVLLNLTPTGSFDKVMFEALSCERIVVALNKGFQDLRNDKWGLESTSPEEIAYKVSMLTTIDKKEIAAAVKASRALVEEKFSLKKLLDELSVYTQ